MGLFEVALVTAFARVVVTFLAVAVCSKAVCNVGFEGGGQHQLPVVFEVGVAFAAREFRVAMPSSNNKAVGEGLPV